MSAAANQISKNYNIPAIFILALEEKPANKIISTDSYNMSVYCLLGEGRGIFSEKRQEGRRTKDQFYHIDNKNGGMP